jgi:hypothetical protein
LLVQRRPEDDGQATLRKRRNRAKPRSRVRSALTIIEVATKPDIFIIPKNSYKPVSVSLIQNLKVVKIFFTQKK